MSRVAKQPVAIGKGVELKLTPQAIELKGPNGLLSQAIHNTVLVKEEDSEGAKVITFAPRNNSKMANAMAGTTRALVNNMMTGVTEGFSRELELVGVGYRAKAQGKKLDLSLGFSHPVEYVLPEGVTAETPSNTSIVLKSINKQKLGQAAAEIRAFRPPEPYKGKGVRYKGEVIVRKETKKK